MIIREVCLEVRMKIWHPDMRKWQIMIIRKSGNIEYKPLFYVLAGLAAAL